MATIELKDFGGFKITPKFEECKEKIENLSVRNNDIWVTSYPKSGTTWTQEMVWLIANDLDYEKAKINLVMRFPFIESDSFYEEWVKFSKKYNIKFNLDPNDGPSFLELVENNKENVRFIKTHLPWDFLPRQIKEGTKTPKIIHVMRNPKQIVPSYYHHMTNVFPMFVGNLNEFVDFYTKGNLLYGDYFFTVLSYWKRKHLPNLLILTYEEMHADIISVIKKVCDFLGKSYDEEQIKKLAHHLGFDQMKTNLAVNVQDYIQNENVYFIRSGKTDSYKKELTPEMIEKLDEWILENIKGTGLSYENE